MKRFILFFLSFVLILSTVSCGETTDQPQTEEASDKVSETADGLPDDKWKHTAEPNNYTVEDKSTKQKLGAIPIANASMTTDELRRICVDFLHLSLEFPWMPKQTFTHEDLNITREPGTVYGGIPYLSTGSGNIYRAMEYFDETTGTIDMSAFLIAGLNFGNACSGGVGWAWQRVINSADISWTWSLTHHNGCLRVGPYTYPDTVENFHEVRSESINKYTAADVVAANGEQVMYESYALVRLADGLVHPGHVRMVTGEPFVVRSEDGSIDGAKSYLYYSDQVKYVNEDNHNRTQTDGTPYKAQGGVRVKISFSELFNTNYIPFTFGEFLGIDPVEPSNATIGIESPTVTVEQLKSATLTCNYAISDIFFKVTAPDGTQKVNFPRRMENFFTKSVDMEKEVMISAIINQLKTMATGSDHTVTILCQISTGEMVTAYTGTLTE